MNDHASLLTCPLCEGEVIPTEDGAVCRDCESRFTQEGIDALSEGEHADPADPFEAMAG
jgi:hypothetical protein